MASAGFVPGLGGYVDRSDRRTAMIAANLAGFAFLVTIPVAAAGGWLTFPHLCVAAAGQATISIAYTAAAASYVKHLVPPAELTSASARLDTAGWLTQSAGPPAGGLLIGAVGPTVTVLADAVSYLASALMLLRAPGAPSPRAAGEGRDLLGGWRWIAGHPVLRLLYLNAMVFGAAIMWTSPLLAVRLLQEMGATAWQYGLVLGVPCLGGLAGAMLSAKVAARYGQDRMLVLCGALRAPWLLALPFLAGVYAVMVCETLLLVSAGLFNPVFAAYRARATPPDLMGRVAAAWALGSKTVQPLFIVVGGIAATVLSLRTSLFLAGVMCLASAVCLPSIRLVKSTGQGAEPAPSGALPSRP